MTDSDSDSDTNADTAPITIDGETIAKRSVMIDGHQTSISLEDAFWQQLGAIAKRRGVSVNKLIAAIDHARTTNLSSAVRVFVLNELRQRLG